MPNNQKQIDRAVRWGGPCPDCGCKIMVRFTKDANSPVLGRVRCEDGCGYEADYQAFREAWLAARSQGPG